MLRAGRTYHEDCHTMRMLSLLFGAMLVIGCGKHMPEPNPDPVQITGRVTQGGKPVSDVTLTLQPVESGAQANLPVKNGDVKGSVFPGTYTFFIAEGTNAAAFKKIPEKYHAGSMDRKMEVKEGTKLDIKLD